MFQYFLHSTYNFLIFCQNADVLMFMKKIIKNSSENNFPHCVIRTCDRRSKREGATTELV